MKIWKDIEGHVGIYQISNEGEVKNVRRGKILTPYDNGNGYKYVCLMRNGKKTRVSVHRLVATHFIPNPFNKSEVNHIDSDKANNHHTNLEWATASENSIHRARNETVANRNAHGAKTYRLISPAGEVIMVHNLRMFCESIGMSYPMFQRIVDGKTKASKSGWSI